MKKRILAVFLIISTLFVLSGCAVNTGASEEYYFDRSVINPNAVMHNTLSELSQVVYEETFLKLFDDGTWVIDMPLMLIFSGNIEKGTYTKQDGLYIFEGLEDYSAAIGRPIPGGFMIECYVSTSQGPVVFETFYFVEFEYVE